MLGYGKLVTAVLLSFIVSAHASAAEGPRDEKKGLRVCQVIADDAKSGRIKGKLLKQEFVQNNLFKVELGKDGEGNTWSALIESASGKFYNVYLESNKSGTEGETLEYLKTVEFLRVGAEIYVLADLSIAGEKLVGKAFLIESGQFVHSCSW